MHDFPPPGASGGQPSSEPNFSRVLRDNTSATQRVSEGGERSEEVEILKAALQEQIDNLHNEHDIAFIHLVNDAATHGIDLYDLDDPQLKKQITNASEAVSSRLSTRQDLWYEAGDGLAYAEGLINNGRLDFASYVISQVQGAMQEEESLFDNPGDDRLSFERDAATWRPEDDV